MILENNQRIFLNCHENLYKKRSNGIFCGFPNLQDFHQNGSTFLWNFAVIFLSSNSSHISTYRIIISHKLVSYIFFAILVNIYWKLCQIRGYDRQFCLRKTKFKPVNFFNFSISNQGTWICYNLEDIRIPCNFDEATLVHLPELAITICQFWQNFWKNGQFSDFVINDGLMNGVVPKEILQGGWTSSCLYFRKFWYP